MTRPRRPAAGASSRAPRRAVAADLERRRHVERPVKHVGGGHAHEMNPGRSGPGAAALGVGLGSVSAQIIVPFAAHLSKEATRGAAVGKVVSGLLLGIMLARPAASRHVGRRSCLPKGAP